MVHAFRIRPTGSAPSINAKVCPTRGNLPRRAYLGVALASEISLSCGFEADIAVTETAFTVVINGAGYTVSLFRHLGARILRRPGSGSRALRLSPIAAACHAGEREQSCAPEGARSSGAHSHPSGQALCQLPHTWVFCESRALVATETVTAGASQKEVTFLPGAPHEQARLRVARGVRRRCIQRTVRSVGDSRWIRVPWGHDVRRLPEAIRREPTATQVRPGPVCRGGVEYLTVPVGLTAARREQIEERNRVEAEPISVVTDPPPSVGEKYLETARELRPADGGHRKQSNPRTVRPARSRLKASKFPAHPPMLLPVFVPAVRNSTWTRRTVSPKLAQSLDVAAPTSSIVVAELEPGQTVAVSITLNVPSSMIAGKSLTQLSTPPAADSGAARPESRARWPDRTNR